MANAYLPPQHGAWAFLGLPVLLAATVPASASSTASQPASTDWWLVVLLAAAWVVAYPASYAALGTVRARRPERFRQPLVVWSAVLVPLVVVLLVARPWLVWVGLVMVALFAVNVRYASRNDERALANDAVFMVECALMVPVTWAVGAGEQTLTPPPLTDVPHQVWVLTVLCLLVLLGSTLHVKSLIRERRDSRYALASRVVAVASLAASVGLATWWGTPTGWWLVVPFVVLVVRAFVVGRRSMRPGVIGMVELAAFVTAVLSAWAA